jgi:penicillin-binding protein 2
MLDYRERKELRDYLEERRLNRRLILVRVILIVLFLSCLGGTYYLQVVSGERYRVLADHNRLRKEVIRPLRGKMYDRKGKTLVANRTARNVVLDREKPANILKTVNRVAPVLGLTEEMLLDRIGRYDARPSFEPAILAEDVHLEQIAWFEARRDEFPEIAVTTESRRDYLFKSELAHVVGYVGEATDAQLAADPGMTLGDIVGKSGLEKVYDESLRGRRGERLVEVNSIGRPLGELHVTSPPEAGRDIYLSIDRDLQEKLVTAFEDEVGAGVFLDPNNGEILALVSRPAFKPLQFTSRFSPETWNSIINDPLHPLQNRAISSTYSPGSTFKLVVAVAALEEGIINEGTAIRCRGAARFYGRRFGCWKKGGHGAVTVHRALVQSCNVFFYTVGQQLGIERIARYAKEIGFSAATRIDLTGERAGTVPSPEWKERTYGERWYPGETISVAIGQGPIEVTALQMANMAACIANGGPIYRPHVTRAEAGVSHPAEILKKASFSSHTLDVIRRAMWGVVHESGTGGRARLANVEVVGKTGTVQVYKASAGVDADELPKDMRDHSWFVGYAPRDKPEIAFAVFVEHGGHGGTSSAPIVRKVLALRFSPDRRPGLGVTPSPVPADPAVIARATTAR